MNYYIIPKSQRKSIIYSQVIMRARAINKVFGARYAFVTKDRTIPVESHEIQELNYLDLIRKVSAEDRIYTRSFYDFFSYVILRIIGVNVIYDFRGFVAFESYLKNRSVFRFMILFIIEFFCYVLASEVYTVSEKFKVILQQKFILKRKIIVIPCLTSIQDRCIERSEDEYGVTGVVRFVFLGGSSQWQNVDKVLAVFSKVIDNMDSTLDIITLDVSAIQEKLHKHNEFVCSKIRVFSLEPEQVSNVLHSYDFGFLLRDNILLNKVAAPIKFLEYCSAGVVPIITPYVGDYAEIVKDRDAAIVFEDGIDLVDTINSIDLKLFKSNTRKLAIFYSWENYLHLSFSPSSHII